VRRRRLWRRPARHPRHWLHARGGRDRRATSSGAADSAPRAAAGDSDFGAGSWRIAYVTRGCALKQATSATRPRFKNLYLAFVDILGFKDIIQRMSKEPQFFTTVRDALKTV
jgi:hypothetical protein